MLSPGGYRGEWQKEICWLYIEVRARCDAVGWGTVLRTGSPQVWFPMESMEFFTDIILPAALCFGIDTASNRHTYQEYFLGGKDGRCVRLTTLPPSCANFLEIWGPQTPGTLRACPSLYRDCFTLYTKFARLVANLSYEKEERIDQKT